MMHRFNVFLDSNIYISEKYLFDESKFRRFQKLISDGFITLVCSDIVIEEVKKHIKDDVSSAYKELIKALSNRGFEALKDKISERMSDLSDSDLISQQIQRFEKFLSDCRASIVSADEIPVSEVMNDHFALKPPFSLKKDKEFKDSFIIKSILKNQLKQLQAYPDNKIELCVVSNDDGFIEAISNNPGVICFRSLNQVLDHVILSVEKPALSIKKHILSKIYDQNIHDWVTDFIWNADLIVDEETEDFELESISDIRYKIGFIGIEDDDSAFATIEVETEISVRYTYLDEANSYFDKEDWEYLFKNYIEVRETHSLNIELELTLKIERLDMESDLSEIKGYLLSEDELSDESNILIDLYQIDSWISSVVHLDEDTILSSSIINETRHNFDDSEWNLV
jgi:virulence-associated protein VapD